MTFRPLTEALLHACLSLMVATRRDERRVTIIQMSEGGQKVAQNVKLDDIKKRLVACVRTSRGKQHRFK